MGPNAHLGMLALYRGGEVYHVSGWEAHYRCTDVVVGMYEHSLLVASVFPGKQVAKNVKGEEVLED